MTQKKKSDEEIRKKLQASCFCEDKVCSQHFVFTISEFDLTKKDERKRKFKGKCQACHDKIALTEEQFYFYERLFGKANLKVIVNNYDNLFE
jgi:hypothetical protein